MLVYEKGNLVTGNYSLFCHQVNCRGVMGSGVARQIKERYPEVFKEYYHNCCIANYLLGTILAVETNDNRMCINMYAQDGYGRTGVHTDYEAFLKCLDQIKLFLENNNVTDDCKVAFPDHIGCGLGGGNWGIIENMIRDFSKKIKQDVVIVSLE